MVHRKREPSANPLCAGRWTRRSPFSLRLTVLVEAGLALDPFSERLFIFTNRREDAVKILYWERNGFCLWQKKLERERFK